VVAPITYHLLVKVVDLTLLLAVDESIVMKLMSCYLNQGHHLYVDNGYKSRELFEILHRNRSDACGIVRKIDKDCHF